MAKKFSDDMDRAIVSMRHGSASRAMLREIMAEFADLTGLSSVDKAPRRYLWTDAFAVCNFLELYRQTGDEAYQDLALHLVDQVHHTLGRHREEDRRTGWISGLDEQLGELHPTKGGLRIGKKMNERRLADPLDERLEWDRDGQYYHYLTKWMHALNRVSQVTGVSIYNRWAIELAKTAHERFTYQPPSVGQKRMYWKMSIDLSYPLVPSMGQHDPLEGFITYSQLQASGVKDKDESTWPDLGAEIADMAKICEGKSWATDDPLGIGGLLSDAFKVAQLIATDGFEQIELPEILLDSSRQGLDVYARTNHLELPAAYRLAFRELGLSIGLRAVERLERLIKRHSGRFKKRGALLSLIEGLEPYARMGDKIEGFWLEEANRAANSWKAHRDINMVMLGTSLGPDGYLTI